MSSSPQMSNPLTALRRYASMSPSAFPQHYLFYATPECFAIEDLYPKAKLHYLVLPRVRDTEGLDAETLVNLATLLRKNKKLARKVLGELKRDAEVVKSMLQQEMVDHLPFGFKWDIWMGFHRWPSMQCVISFFFKRQVIDEWDTRHLHLHVISADLVSDRLKHKKHYNSFHPTLGCFLHLDEVLSWFDAEPGFFQARVQDLRRSTHERILKTPLTCFHCDADFSNMPLLKRHLEKEWEMLKKQRLASKTKLAYDPRVRYVERHRLQGKRKALVQVKETDDEYEDDKGGRKSTPASGHDDEEERPAKKAKSSQETDSGSETEDDG